MSVELNIWSAYLPYNVKCQFEGIINGREISKQRKEFQIENEPFTNWEYYEPIKEIVGTKIAPLKAIRVYKKYFVVNCGIYAKGLKNFYNGNGAKLILRPMEDLKYYVDFLNTYYVDFDKSEGCLVKRKNENFTRLNELDFLFKNHFDVFGLIEKGLAVGINTLSV